MKTEDQGVDSMTESEDPIKKLHHELKTIDKPYVLCYQAEDGQWSTHWSGPFTTIIGMLHLAIDDVKRARNKLVVDTDTSPSNEEGIYR